MQAVILAAGMGKRLGHRTQDNTKCMVEVNGEPLIKRLLRQLHTTQNIRRVIVVTGYCAENLENYLNSSFFDDMEIITIRNDKYATTNNIYSLSLAKSYLDEDDTILIESDLKLDDRILETLIKHPNENVAAVAKYKYWHDGTMVTLDASEDNILSFISRDRFSYHDVDKYYKTLNVYKFSNEFMSSTYIPFIEVYLKVFGMNAYYEQILKLLVYNDTKSVIHAAVIPDEWPWYEIDDEQDFRIAECMFEKRLETKLSTLQKMYGGYWRFPNIKDYCYLVNPYFPTPNMMDEMKFNFSTLLQNYPSGRATMNMLASKCFGVDERYIRCFNGLTEVMPLLAQMNMDEEANVSIPEPTFDEYLRQTVLHSKTYSSLLSNTTSDSPDPLIYTAQEIVNSHELIRTDGVNETIYIVNPDNPSGNFIPKDEMVNILDYSKIHSIRVIVDESFIDFADKDKRYTLLSDDVLLKYPNLSVVKSISKSFGIPGVRLGILATSNELFLNKLDKKTPIWNINSFSEFFLQIFSKYKSKYIEACDKIAENRTLFVNELEAINNTHRKVFNIIPSQSNYITLRFDPKSLNAYALTVKLLEYDFFIKDLSSKKNCENCVRIAIKTNEENILLVEALDDILNQL